VLGLAMRRTRSCQENSTGGGQFADRQTRRLWRLSSVHDDNRWENRARAKEGTEFPALSRIPDSTGSDRAGSASPARNSNDFVISVPGP